MPGSREASVLHAAAIASLAVAQVAAMGAAVAVYRDGAPDSPAYPYLVVWGAPAGPVAAAERLYGYGGEAFTTTQITAAGLTVDDVLGAVDIARQALHRRKPTIAGRVCGDLEMDGAPSRPAPDPVRSPAGLQVWSTPMFFLLMSSPATNSEGA